jgi:cysteine-rich repeat protein
MDKECNAAEFCSLGRCQTVVCGNGVVERAETCDDGNTKAGDGCSDRCALELGYCCMPGDRCIAAGLQQTNNPCLVCDPTLEATKWTNTATDTTCGGMCALRCGEGDGCIKDSDCNSGRCFDRKCVVCNDACTLGVRSCTAGQVKRCITDANGCYVWSTPESCPGGACADTTTCAGCSNTCSAVGETSCSAGAVRTCGADQFGCLTWGVPQTCATNSCADATHCGVACANACSATTPSTCTGGKVSFCLQDANGCFGWSIPSDCPGNTCADTTRCQGTCANTCSTAGLTDCQGGTLRQCLQDQNGCLAWSMPSQCPSNTCADATHCQGSCANTCTTAGLTNCQGGVLFECLKDQNDCLAWSAPQTCALGTCASTTACSACQHQCGPKGSTVCKNGVQFSCDEDSFGCLVLGPGAECLTGSCSADGMTCHVCQDACEIKGVLSCSGSVVQTCVIDTFGCKVWEADRCLLGQCADAGSCPSCLPSAAAPCDQCKYDWEGAACWLAAYGKNRLVNEGLDHLFMERPDIVSPGGPLYGEEATSLFAQRLLPLLDAVQRSMQTAETTAMERYFEYILTLIATEQYERTWFVYLARRWKEGVVSACVTDGQKANVAAYFDYLMAMAS